MKTAPPAPGIGSLMGVDRLFRTSLLLAMTAFAAGAWAQDPCADCHAAQELEETEEFHLRQWRNSAHAVAGVSCADCHGGNNTTFVQLRAHKGVLNSGHPKSPTHQWNLPRTCGRCHDAEYLALQQSTHFALFERRVRAAPTCRTCHGSVAAQSLGEGGLQARCNRCHGPEADHREAGTSGQEALAKGGQLLARMRALRGARARVSRDILRVEDPSDRHEAADALFEANRAWEEAIEAGHAFHWSDWDAALGELEGLLGEIEGALAPDGGR